LKQIKSNEKLFEIFNPEKYNFDPCPVYIYVDMLTILIQYEYMVYKGFTYVIFSDLDIQDVDSLDYDDMICKKTVPGYTDEYYPNKLFDSMTIELLDIFGYLMAGFINLNEIKNESFKERTKSDLDRFGFTPEIYEVNDNYYEIARSVPENSFLISKNNTNVIKAIKNYFIDFLFCNEIYSFIKKKITSTNNHIFNRYIYFIQYLDFLNGLNTLNLIVSESEICEIKEKFINDSDKHYIYKSMMNHQKNKNKFILQ